MVLSAPTWTCVPNKIFELMPQMKEAELRIVLAISRLTCGYHRRSIRISLTGLMKFTGMSRQGVINGYKDAVAHGFLLITKGNSEASNTYVLNVDWGSQPSSTKIVNEVDQQAVNQVDSYKRKHIKENNIKQKGCNDEDFKKAKERLTWDLHDDSKIPPETQMVWLKTYPPKTIINALQAYQEALNNNQDIHSPIGFIFHQIKGVFYAQV